ncbi:hypothetical protein AN958_07457 [Leucoagaricus sp. SymC.cos]|nr:hypothetical protein AN958_07457 [Leucoagaricus sp. SymC.cos]
MVWLLHRVKDLCDTCSWKHMETRESTHPHHYSSRDRLGTSSRIWNVCEYVPGILLSVKLES